MEPINDLANFSISGVYFLLLLSLTFNFLLAIRMRQLGKEFVAYQKTAQGQVRRLNEKLGLLLPEKGGENR